MSSLKDIMDVDVEPLQSQAYRKAKEAVQPRPSGDKSSSAPQSSLGNEEEISTKRRRPNRGPNPASQAIPSRPSAIQQHSSSFGEPMNFQAVFQTGFQTGSSDQASTPGSTHHSSPRGSESMPDVSVKYTPVTHRISKAKKGVRIHTCDSCRKTFSRAEHLRRHQLSHKDPAYPCTFRGCDKVFHRPDLLARHLQRHENEDERPDISPAAQSSPASSGSDPSNSPTPILKAATAVRGAASSSTNQRSLVDPTMPRTSGAVEHSPISFSTAARSFQPHISDAGSSTFPPTTGSNIPNQDCYSEHVQHDLSALPNFATTQIPEELHMPGLSYTKENSPLCSSESGSTYSTQSDASRPGRQWSRRQRSSSVKNVPDWSSATPQFHMNGTVSMAQGLRSPQFDSILGQFESYTSPRMTPSSVSTTLLDAPNSYEGYGVEPVEIPVLSYSKPPTPAFSEPIPQVSDFRLGSAEIKMKPLMEQHLEALRICETMAHLTPLDVYISSYWQSFHTLFPIVHRDTFDLTANILLSSAVAAIGTQYHNTAAARQKGAELNDYCKKSIDLLLNWDLRTMQAILLTEIFTRYRGRKTNIRLSRQFEELYSRLLRNSTQDQTVLSGQNILYVVPGSSLNHHDSTHPTTQHLHHSDDQSEWLRWIDIETRQRLLAFCFMFDSHQSLFHEQNRSNVHHAEITSLLYLPCPDNIWNAGSALDWQAQRGGYVSQPFQLFERDFKSIANRSAFVHGLVMSSLVSGLPPREDPRCPNKGPQDQVPQAISRLRDIFPTASGTHICLALYNTPLHDLLAIAGDTWVFGKKLTPPSAFRTAQSRLKTWSSSLNAATATHHACRILSTLASQPNTQTHPIPCISDYWAYYVSALICWAFGSRHHLPSSRSSSAPTFSPALPRAQKYVSAILALSTEDLLTSRAYLRGDTDGVIDAVREHLEIDAVGSKCMMLVDAVHVLTQLKECGKAKWWFR